MSQAFVKENEEQWLHEIPPSVTALIYHLTKENNGIRVYEKKMVKDSETGKDVHVMSNGLSYSKDDQGRWYVI